MSEFSFEVNQQALDVVRRTSIDANFDECKAALTEMMEPYKNLVVTADGVSSAKSDRARIRKVAERINEVRKEVKRVYTEPLALFEGRCNELCAICDESASNLDGQIKTFDEERKKAKLDELREYFNAHVGDVASYIEFDTILAQNPRWGNVTYTEEQAHSDILREISACHASVGAIKTLRSPFEVALLDSYRATGDLALAMKQHETWTQEQQAQERRKAEQEEARRRAEQQRMAQIEAAQRKNTEDAGKSTVLYTPSEEETPPAEPVRVLDFRVYVNARQASALKNFLIENHIKYGRVPD